MDKNNYQIVSDAINYVNLWGTTDGYRSNREEVLLIVEAKLSKRDCRHQALKLVNEYCQDFDITIEEDNDA